MDIVARAPRDAAPDLNVLRDLVEYDLWARPPRDAGPDLNAYGAGRVAIVTPMAGGIITLDIGLAVETNTAFAFAPLKIGTFTPANEINTALAFSFIKLGTVGLALEVDTAFALSPEAETSSSPRKTKLGVFGYLRSPRRKSLI